MRFQNGLLATFAVLTLVSGPASAEEVDLLGLGDGAQVVGTFDTNYNKFHLRQQGTAISGCYEFREGLFSGTVEGRVAKLTWTESDGKRQGPAVFLFSPDGKSFRGYWWVDADKAKGLNGSWTGHRASADVGGCPHWSGSVGGQLRSDLAAQGRARLDGILFDTDSTSTTVHNQALSEQRAKSVLNYLTGKGVAASPLSAAGFGQSRPVADNATELGRARNRRVELVRK